VDVHYRMADVGTVSVVDRAGEALVTRRYAIASTADQTTLTTRNDGGRDGAARAAPAAPRRRRPGRRPGAPDADAHRAGHGDAAAAVARSHRIAAI
jgi:hypothetical protein